MRRLRLRDRQPKFIRCLAPSSSIIDVSAAHLTGTNCKLAAELQLVLLPNTNGTPCGEKPDHSRAIKISVCTDHC
jgi:hypothetical protein